MVSKHSFNCAWLLKVKTLHNSSESKNMQTSFWLQVQEFDSIFVLFFLWAINKRVFQHAFVCLMQPQTFENTHKLKIFPKIFEIFWNLKCDLKLFYFFSTTVDVAASAAAGAEASSVFDAVWHLNTYKLRHWKCFSVGKYTLAWFCLSWARILHQWEASTQASTAFKSFLICY